MKKVLFTILMSVLTLSSYAYDFYGNGIFYNIISGKTNEVEVTYYIFVSYSGSVIIPSTVTYNNTTYSVTSIGDYTFDECSGLTSVTIPNSVTSIGDRAFSYCSGLTSVTIPNSVTSIGESAFGCSGLTSVTIPNSVTSIGYYAFYNCSGLTSVIYNDTKDKWASISKGSTWKGYSGFTVYCTDGNIDLCGKIYYTSTNGNIVTPNKTSAFGGAKIIRNTYENGQGVIIFDREVTSIGSSAFNKCSSLTSITIPISVTSIEYETFQNCSGLKSVTIPNSVTSIGMCAFALCSGLTSIEIPNSVIGIGKGAFQNCSRLTSITIPNSVTSIEYETFYNCSGLTSVTIPNSVTSIDSYAFENCSGLKDVYYYATTPPSIESYTFTGLPSNKTLHVVKGCKSAYTLAKYWKDFNIVEDLEPTAVKNIKKYKDNNLDNNIYNWQGFKGEGQINIKNRKKFVK